MFYCTRDELDKLKRLFEENKRLRDGIISELEAENQIKRHIISDLRS